MRKKNSTTCILNILYIDIWIYKWYKIKITCTEIIDKKMKKHLKIIKSIYIDSNKTANIWWKN